MTQSFESIADANELWRQRQNLNSDTLLSNSSGTAAPGYAVEGTTWWKSDTDVLRVYDGSSWQDIAIGGSAYDPSSVAITGGTIADITSLNVDGTVSFVGSDTNSYFNASGAASDSDLQIYIGDIMSAGNGVRIFIDDANSKLELRGNIEPASDSLYSFGTSSARWSNIYTDALTCTNTVTANGFEGAAATLTSTNGSWSYSDSGDPEVELEGDSARAFLRLRTAHSTGTNVIFAHSSRGTQASPSGTQSGDDCFAIAIKTYNGTNVEDTIAGLVFECTETHGASAGGGKWVFSAAPDASRTDADVFEIYGNGNVRIAVADVPSSASDTGAAGTISWDTNYIYVCTASNTWKRAALATW